MMRRNDIALLSKQISRGFTSWRGELALALCACLCFAAVASAQPEVNFPPPGGKPPPPRKTPPRKQSSGEDTGIFGESGPGSRKTQERVPPPPPTLTVMHKLKYGQTLKYTYPDGTVQTFEQWKSYPSDGYRLISAATEHLGDKLIYEYTAMPLAAEGGFDPVDIPLLYMAGDYDFKFTDAEVENLASICGTAGRSCSTPRAVAKRLPKRSPGKCSGCFRPNALCACRWIIRCSTADIASTRCA